MSDSTPIVSLVSDTADTTPLAGLFSKSVRKPLPVYDYAAVPDRVGGDATAQAGGEDVDIDEDEGPEDLVKEKKEVQKHDRMAQVKHEDSKPRQINPETEARTVFVGNLPSSIKKQMLKSLFSQAGKVESVRFRCAARPDLKTTKKVAVIKHKFHEERNNISAYVRMATVEEAETACSINNTQVEGLTIRVDMALKGKSHDNKKAVFLGNLDFKTQEEDIRKLFSKCGEVENVRLVRDSATGIGKGFGYVNFVSEDSVGLAIRLNNQEVCTRKVRVTRSVRKAKPGKVMVADSSNRKERREDKFKPAGGANKKKAGPSDKKAVRPNKKRFDRSQSYQKGKKGDQPEGKSFQGLSSTSDKKPKRSFNKTLQRNKIIAKKLAS